MVGTESRHVADRPGSVVCVVTYCSLEVPTMVPTPNTAFHPRSCAECRARRYNLGGDLRLRFYRRYSSFLAGGRMRPAAAAGAFCQDIGEVYRSSSYGSAAGVPDRAFFINGAIYRRSDSNDSSDIRRVKHSRTRKRSWLANAISCVPVCVKTPVLIPY